MGFESEPFIKPFMVILWIIIVLIGILVLVIVGVELGDYSKITNNKHCQEIGFERYEVVDGEQFCTNDGVNLYRIKEESDGILFPKYKFTRIEIHDCNCGGIR
jgi:hypothetical protein